MKPGPFTYHAPSTVAEALGVLAEFGDDAKVLAGGQSLVPILALRLGHFPHLVDLNRIRELAGIAVEGDRVRVGAMTRQTTIEHDPTLVDRVPLLARATPLIGHFQTRNRGTLGGSIAHADPSAEYPAVAVALDATVEITGLDGRRDVPADAFFQGMWTTTVGFDEIVSAVHCGVRRPGDGFGICEVARRHGDFALVGTACSVSVDGNGSIVAASIAMFGVGTRPMRAAAAESALHGADARHDLREIGRIALEDVEPSDDVHASANYRSRVGEVTVVRALRDAIEDAMGGA